jgi:hypothetical protein
MAMWAARISTLTNKGDVGAAAPCLLHTIYPPSERSSKDLPLHLLLRNFRAKVTRNSLAPDRAATFGLVGFAAWRDIRGFWGLV